ncbi:hypothetical protein [Sphingomonas sp.]|uniref:hypothetical protein n=1 Tax=Sphingomonas sp. TaxID=28214 RepID=UPI0018376761|nr:hypothetical protein [Sphingomonas sp.]MBA3512149.1 hypothetical protein [Sphingomonas sp.]
MADRIDRRKSIANKSRPPLANANPCEALGKALHRAFATDHSASFDEALKAIDEADSEVCGNRDPADSTVKIANCAAPDGGS